jgi:hypothetical protein
VDHSPAVADPVSIAFYYMMYAGVDVDANPEFAYAAVENQHLSPIDRVSITDSVLDVARLPAHYTSDRLLDLDRRFSTSHHPEAATVSQTGGGGIGLMGNG